MANITFHGDKIKTIGELPKVGSQAPDFVLTGLDLSTKTLADFKGKKIVLNIFPSVDTGTCATSVKTFNQKAARNDKVQVVCISKDLPFAQGRFCGAEGIENLTMLSDFVTGDFGKNYGVTIESLPLKGLHARAIVVIDEDGTVVYTEQVQETADEPNYEAALALL